MCRGGLGKRSPHPFGGIARVQAEGAGIAADSADTTIDAASNSRATRSINAAVAGPATAATTKAATGTARTAARRIEGNEETAGRDEHSVGGDQDAAIAGCPPTVAKRRHERRQNPNLSLSAFQGGDLFQVVHFD